MLLFFLVLSTLAVVTVEAIKQHSSNDELSKKEHASAEANTTSASNQTFSFELTKVNLSIQSLNSFIDTNNHSWLHYENLALAYLDRARLSGEFTDYQQADNAIKQAFAISGPQAGPFLTRAIIHLALHQTDAAFDDLDRVSNRLLLDRKTALTLDGLIGEAQLQSDDTDVALERFELLDTQHPTFKNATRLSQTYAKKENYRMAKHWLLKAGERTTHQSNYLNAWLELQHGILSLEQDQLEEAYQYFTKADQIFPGYWLIEEHLAEVDALSGRTALAEDRYRAIVDRTTIPQMILALADVLEAHNGRASSTEIESLRTKANQQLSIIETTYPTFVTAH